MSLIKSLVILLLSVAKVVIVLIILLVGIKQGRRAQRAADKAFRLAGEDERQRAEAERRRLEEDLRRAEEKRQQAGEEPSKVAEAQCQTEELGKADEEQRHFEAGATPSKAGARQLAEDEDRRVDGVESKRKPLQPGKRGGRPRTSTYHKKPQISQEARPRTPKPEVICRKRERQWILAVEIPGKLLGTPDLEVLQGGQLLRQDESCEDCWPLNDAYGQVVVKWNTGYKVVRLADKVQSYLLFKLSGQDKDQGRRVTSCSSGSYLVVVPEDWQRDDAISGPPPVAPEPVSLPRFSAHFFELGRDADSKIAFLTPSGPPVIITPKATRFRLVGTQLNDASEGIGPLFGERPPKISALDDQAWGDISTIVIGEEGSGRGRWRTQMTPVPDVLEQDLPSEVADRKGGWYFVRLYNRDDDLIESLDFRFLSALKDIRVPQPPPFPSEDGHQPISVELLHESGCTVQPAGGLTNMQIEYKDDKTIVTIPPDVAYDETRWLVGPKDGPQVELTILVERLWWAVGEEDLEPSKWVDRPVTLGREDFAATSKQALWLRLPRRRWVDKIHVGFERWKARPYDVRVTEKTIAIPLRDFCDALEVRGTGIIPLKLWICRKGMTYEGTLCEFKIKLRCKFCNFDTSNEEDMFSHVGSFHLSDFFRSLTYEELRDHIRPLPYKIYQCSYCNYCVEVELGDLRNPHSTICDHIEQDCPKVSREMGPVRISFRIISDPDEIRKNVTHNLPHIYKCQLCNCVLKNPVESDMIDHLVRSHRNKLYESC